jgi:amino acid adenylation domain-containing protein
LEAAAGVVGLLKVALALDRGQLPPSLHLNSVNPRIDLDQLALRVPRRLEPWPERDGPALAGVSSFGFGGTNAHVVLEGPPGPSLRQPPGRPNRAQLLPLSARTPMALRALIQHLRDALDDPEELGGPGTTLEELSYAAGVRRAHYDNRLALVASSRAELAVQLDSVLAGNTPLELSVGCYDPRRPPRVVFVFPGQGSQWPGMGCDLLGQESAFQEALEECDQLLRPHTGWSLLARLQEVGQDDCASPLLEDSEVAQPALVAVEVALARLWRSWGIVPDAIVGHSLGEVAAATVAGSLSLADAMRLAAVRGALMQEMRGRGWTALVEMPPDEVERELAAYDDSLGLAAWNGPTSALVSGDPGALAELLTKLSARGVPARRLRAEFAYHSEQMAPLQGPLAEALRGLAPHAAGIRIVSTVTASDLPGHCLDSAYWARNLREPVRFAPAVDLLARDGYDVFIEVGPNPVLADAISAGARIHGSATVVGSLHRGRNGRQAMLTALGKLWVRGCPVDWVGLCPAEVRPVRLLPYPWQRERFWFQEAQPILLAEPAQPANAHWTATGGPVSQPAKTGKQPGEPAERRRLLAAAKPERAGLVESYMRDRLAGVLRFPADRVNVHTPLSALGLDSMLAMELRSRIETDLGLVVSVAALLQGPSVREVAAVLTEQLATLEPTPSVSVRQPAPVALRDGAAAAQLVTHGERALWFLHRLTPESPAYNVTFAAQAKTGLDVDALRYALQALIDRHPALRTTYATVDGAVVRRVAEHTSLDLMEQDATNWSKETLQAHLVEEAERPFDLERGPLLRARVFAQPEGGHTLLLAAHHIIVDLWSLAVLLEELRVLYRAARLRKSAGLHPAAASYADFVRWQADLLASPEGRRIATWWERQLAGELPLLDLPTDRPRPPVRAQRGGRYTFHLDERLTERVNALARDRGVTPFTLLLAVYQVLLHRWSGQREVLVGSVTAGRPRAAFDRVVGYFVNPLVMRADLAGNPSFDAFLAQVCETVLGALDHQDYPFPLLVERLQPHRDPSRPPVFQAAFGLETAPRNAQRGLWLFASGQAGGTIDLDGSTLEACQFHHRSTQHDLLMLLDEVNGVLHGVIEYDVELFEPATMERLSTHYRNLLEAIVADPGQRVADLPLLSPTERKQLLTRWNRTGAGRPSPGRCLQDLFDEQVRRTPDGVAVACGGQDLTYRELDRRASGLARTLQDRGIEPETLIALSADGSPELVVGLLGVLKAGGAVVPLDPMYPLPRLELMLRDAKPSLLLTMRRFLHRLPSTDSPVLLLDGPPRETSPPNPRSGVDGAPMRRNATARNLAFVIYTSGSTGAPKGVLVEHAGLANLAIAQQELFGIGPGDRVLQFASLSFDAAVWECTMALFTGATLCLAERAALVPGPQLTRLLQDERITVVTLPPSILATLDPSSVPALSTVIAAGEACSEELINRWAPGRRLFNAYGPTEASVCTTIEPCVVDHVGPPPIGLPIPGVRAYVLDDRTEPVPIGVRGQLYVGGAGVTRGYLHRGALTAEQFIPDPFGPEPGGRLYATGDLARRLPDGRIQFLGRLDHQVKVRGFRIEPGEVEAALRRYSGVEDAVVGTSGDTRLVAWVVPRTAPAADTPTVACRDRSGNEGTAATAMRLRRHLACELPAHLIPSRFVFLSTLPRTPNGKIDRRALPEPDQARPELGQPFAAPRTPIEADLAAIWAEVLGMERVGVQDDFFDLGGHSLLITQIVARVRSVLGMELPVRAVFEAPTVSALAEHIGSAQGAGDDLAPPIQPILRPAEGMELSPAQRRLWFLEQLEPGSGTYHICGGLRLRGPLDRDILARALGEVVCRHEALRTTFQAVEGQARQIIAPPPPSGAIHLPLVDLAGRPPAERDAELRRLATEHAARPFDLTRAPLRACLALLRPDGGEHVLLLAIHHIVADGWSMDLLLRELAQLYRAFAAGDGSPLPALPVQYADVAAWQWRRLRDDGMGAQLRWWERQLASCAPVLNLPTDYPRPSRPAHRGARAELTIPRVLTHGIKRLAQSEKATTFMVLLAAFEVLLARWSGQESFVVGTPVAGRGQRETEELIGLFANTVALRGDLSGEPTFRELLRRVREVTLDAFSHQDVPFEHLVERLQPGRDLTRTPLFQVMFNLLSFQETSVDLPGLEAEVIESPEPRAKFDLTLYARCRADEIDLEFVYDADLFTAKRMRIGLEQLRELLAQATSAPNRSIGDFSLVTASTRYHLPHPARPILPHWTGSIHARVAAQAMRAADRIAVVDAAGTLTYGTLREATGHVARELRADGLRPGDRVVIHADRGGILVCALLAVLEAGGAVAILDPRHPAPRLAHLVRLAAPRGWIEAEGAEPPPDPLAALAEALPIHRCLSRPTAITAGDAARSGEAGGAAGWIARTGDLAHVTFTSGSTGQPKAVLGPHGPLAHFVRWYTQRFQLNERDRFSMLSGLGHDPLLRDVLVPLALGATLCIPHPDIAGDPDALVRWLSDQHVTVAHLTPTMCRLIQWAAPSPLPALRYAIVGGDVLTADDVAALRQRAPSATVVNAYGAAETPQVVAAHVVSSRAATDSAVLPLGRGVGGAQLLVRTRRDRVAGVGELGEICVRTPYLALGYAGDDALTALRFTSDPHGRPGDRIYRTGDLGRFLPDGTVTFAGRVDRQVKVRGVRVEPAEIEACLRQHPGVRDVVVVATPDPRDGARLTAFAELAAVADGAAADGDDLRRLLAGRLPEAMQPVTYILLDELPRTPNGKVDLTALSALALAGKVATGSPRPARPARSQLERAIATVWQAALGVDSVDLDDNFFDLGGHSLLVVEVQARLRATLGRNVAVVDLFRYPTVAALAEYLLSGEGRSFPAKDTEQSRAREDHADLLARRRQQLKGVRRRG